jgi:tRNA(Ile)-lysidine synthase
VARKTGSLEAALRKFRYEFLQSSVESFGARWLLTGHTANDQVETVLFRVLRKMNVMALSGIPEKRSGILRPLLGLSRDLTLRYCLEHGIEPLQDTSNLDHRFTRNRIRHITIPALESMFHPGLKTIILQMSSLVSRMIAAEDDLLGELGQTGLDTGKGIISIRHVNVLPPATRETLIGRFMHTMTGRWPSRSLIKEAIGRLNGQSTGRIFLPGGMAMDSDGQNVTIKQLEAESSYTLPEKAVCLPVPGKVYLSADGITLTSEEKALKAPLDFPAGDTALIRRTRLRMPLWVRKRLPGDRFNPLGMLETKKLKEFFIDRKIPRSARDSVPLVLDNDGEILWVAGVEISQKAALAGYVGEDAVLLKIERKEGD